MNIRQRYSERSLEKGYLAPCSTQVDNEEERESNIRRMLSRRLWMRDILRKNRSNSATKNRITKDDCQSYHKIIDRTSVLYGMDTKSQGEGKARIIICAVS